LVDSPIDELPASTPADGAHHEAGDALSDETSLNPADLLTAALESDEVSESDLEAVDTALDDLMASQSLSGSASGKGKALLSVDEAQAKLGPDILKALGDKFKGSLTQVRHLDERDQIF
jgi:hypothetical protein